MRGGYIYNNVITAHGIIVIFYAVMPILIGGYGNYMMPIQIGAPEVSFPRINGFSLWLLIPSGMLFIYATIINRGIGQGWTLYYPLTSNWASSGTNIDVTIFAFHLAGISSLLGGINMITTIYNMRCKGMKWGIVPLYTWAILITAILLLISLPILTVGITLMLMDRNVNSSFYEASSGGDPLLYITLFWLFGHPEIYILIIPAFGIVSEIISKMSGRGIFGRKGMIMAIISIAVLGVVVWAHHEFTEGMDLRTKLYFSSATMVIALPTGIKIFSWLMTLYEGEVRRTIILNYGIAFIFLFTIGGLSGVALSSSILDINYHDSYFIIAHFHIVLSLGAVYGILGGYYYWSPKMLGVNYEKKTGYVGFWLLTIGALTTFMPMHNLGLEGMPRRYKDYAGYDTYETWHYIASYGSTVNIIALIIIIKGMIDQISRGSEAEEDMWSREKYYNRKTKKSVYSLELMISTPPAYHTFEELPVIIEE